MKVRTKTVELSEIDIYSLLNNFEFKIIETPLENEWHKDIIKFVVINKVNNKYICEVDNIVYEKGERRNWYRGVNNNIFNFHKREYENTDEFNVALIIPTGIDADTGGHCGDANVIARLIGSTCDNLITHPNVVNAADYNEMPDNTLYVEGSLLTQLMMGQIKLQKVRNNKMLLIVEKHKDDFFNNEIINAVSTARITLGIDCDIKFLDEMSEVNYLQSIYSGRIIGEIDKLEILTKQIEKYFKYDDYNEYDSLGLITSIGNMPENFLQDYFIDGNIPNPFGGAEAMLTHSISSMFQIPTAHAPLIECNSKEELINFNFGVVDPRRTSETSSITFSHCLLKGLHKTPKIVDRKFNSKSLIGIEDVSCLVIPEGCIGLPTLAAIEHEIPVIFVKDKNMMQDNKLGNEFRKRIKTNKIMTTDNYIEAAGVIQMLKAGISLDTINRPIDKTQVIE